jgi:hypothetical protein
MFLTEAILPNPGAASLLRLLLLTMLLAFVLPPSMLWPAEVGLRPSEPALLLALLVDLLHTVLLLGSLKPAAVSAAAMPASENHDTTQGR